MSKRNIRRLFKLETEQFMNDFNKIGQANSSNKTDKELETVEAIETEFKTDQEREVKAFMQEYNKQINKLSDDIKKRDELLQDQLKFIAEALAKQRVLLNSLLTKQNDIDSMRKKFPIMDEQHLSEVNKNIVPDNRKEYIEAIKALILHNGIRKNLKNILSAQITYDYNIDGVQGKKSLKALSNFYEVLIDSIPSTEHGNAEEELRKAIQLQKKRHFKQVAAKKIQNQSED